MDGKSKRLYSQLQLVACHFMLRRLPCSQPSLLELSFFTAFQDQANVCLGKEHRIVQLAGGSFRIERSNRCNDNWIPLSAEEIGLLAAAFTPDLADFPSHLGCLMSRIKRTLIALCPWLDSKKVEEMDLAMIGDYEGGWRLEYEVNPSAGGNRVYWPDFHQFTTEHIARFTLGNPSMLVQDAYLSLLCDLPHEVCHLIQGLVHQHGDSWQAIHSMRICNHQIVISVNHR
jgi:hypothetical protein